MTEDVEGTAAHPMLARDDEAGEVATSPAQDNTNPAVPLDRANFLDKRFAAADPQSV
jgi:hypothetical protein